MWSSADFRDRLYATYVSGFKSEQGTADAWWDRKYLPLLHGVYAAAPILDLGCGDGRLLEYLTRRGFVNACGVDVSQEQVALARRRGVNVVQGDLFQHLEGCHSQYAAILTVDVLEHLTRDELIRLAPLLHNALQRPGRLLVQTANGAGLMPGQVIHGDLTHQTIFTPESLGQLLRPAGFEHLSFYETGPVPIRLRGKLDVAIWSAVRAVASAVRYVETGKRQAIWTENFICRAFKPG
jgi:SAM-dependent methyltransferase